MKNLIIPADYHSPLNLHDTQIAIKTVKDFFQNLLAQRLNLARVSAPLFVDPATGLNDNLNGVERPVSFGIKEQNEKRAEVVHSLAKWKRYALQKYGFCEGEGIYTDMNAIRRDEDTDNILHFCRPMGLGKNYPKRRPYAGCSERNRAFGLQVPEKNRKIYVHSV